MNTKAPSHRDQVNALFVLHSPRIRGFILSLIPNMSRADDVMQETFLTVSAKADDYEEGTNFVAWACTIARFKVLEECNRNQKASLMLSPDVIDAVCVAHAPLSAEDDEARLKALKDCMDSLAPHTRRAVELRYTRAHSAAEIASLLGWSTDSVYVVLSRARQALQKCINAHLNAVS
ncbi:sigma-70 family RNA polymerase sigma factor [Aporhodopirellula aestuarii]|uniref:Sigma-70 family RNA polymerase sigma factor n=1 Tax=Aporhodopirellula aestuarii TaxID=2950107 RepID=A0ABT0TX95_9BACT|nr:sigma-70 family RNA polymerase sigma factor [Aporhodopirellula aestuarii]MCM2369216.1 sigma-70 family RNA polymerase sigma factor [Aporhodopirellula aestuarii]